MLFEVGQSGKYGRLNAAGKTQAMRPARYRDADAFTWRAIFHFRGQRDAPTPSKDSGCAMITTMYGRRGGDSAI